MHGTSPPDSVSSNIPRKAEGSASPDVQALDARILRTSYQGRYPSDHFPVKAVVEVG